MSQAPRILKRLSDFRSAPLPRIPSRGQRRRGAPDSDEYDTDLENDDVAEPLVKRSGRGLSVGTSETTNRERSETEAWLSRSAAVRVMAKEQPLAPNRRADAADLTALACALLEASTLSDLDLTDCRMGSSGAKEVLTALTVNLSVSQVNLSNNRLGNTGLSAFIGRLLQTNNHIRMLNLSNNDLQDEDIKYIACGLEANLGLLDLNLSHNCIGEEGAKYLATALSENDVLQDLDLSWNKVRKTGAVALGIAVKQNASLQKLNVAWNGLAYDGALSLRDVLQVNQTLVQLDISNNRINWDGAGLLAEALKSNCHLINLHVGDNPLTTTGALDIIKSIADNPESAILFLDLKGVPVVQQFEMVCAEVQISRPTFKAVHGDIVQLHDIIGERKVRRIHPMQKILDYMYEREMRPIELMRSFDKEGKFMLTAEQFIQRLKSIGIEIRTWEMEELKNFIMAQGRQPGAFINYKKLIESITLQIETERSHRIAMREQSKRIKNKNDQLLGRPKGAALAAADVDLAVSRLTGIKPPAAGSSTDFALRVVSDSVADRRKKSFEAKMGLASSIKEADVNEQTLVSGSAQPAATNQLLHGRRLWMSAALDNVHVRNSCDQTKTAEKKAIS